MAEKLIAGGFLFQRSSFGLRSLVKMELLGLPVLTTKPES
jgi:hypothetical protein